MLNIGLTELLLVAVLAIVVIGPDALPDLLKGMGRLYGRIRGASTELRRTFQSEVDKVMAEQRAEEIQRRREDLVARSQDEGGPPTGSVGRTPSSGVGGEE